MALTRDFKKRSAPERNAIPLSRELLVRGGEFSRRRRRHRKDNPARLHQRYDRFQRTGGDHKHSPKSLMRMLGPSGNPYARHLFEIVSCLQKKTGVHFQLKALAATVGR